MFNILNHELDSSFLKSTIDNYIKICEAYPDRPNIDEFDYQINQFIQNRPDFVRNRLIKYFKKDSLYEITIEAEGNTEYGINGHLIKGDFKGVYYSGQKVQIQIPNYLVVSKLKTNETIDTKKLIHKINRNYKLIIIQN